MVWSNQYVCRKRHCESVINPMTAMLTGDVHGVYVLYLVLLYCPQTGIH